MEVSIDVLTPTFQAELDEWKGKMGKPVPLIIPAAVWNELADAVEEPLVPTDDPALDFALGT